MGVDGVNRPVYYEFDAFWGVRDDLETCVDIWRRIEAHQVG